VEPGKPKGLRDSTPETGHSSFRLAGNTGQKSIVPTGTPALPGEFGTKHHIYPGGIIMKTVALHPFTIETALDDFDKYIGSVFGESPLAPVFGKTGQAPAVDIRETDDAYLMEAELPGYDEKNIRVQMDGNTLTIESKKEEENNRDLSPKRDGKKGEDRFIIRERRRASFSRSFKLPEDADTESVSAVFKNGLLNLEIKKRAGTQKRVIQIGAGQE
jgi:HSP20 family protein